MAPNNMQNRGSIKKTNGEYEVLEYEKEYRKNNEDTIS